MTLPPEDREVDLEGPTRMRPVSGASKLIGAVLGQQYELLELIGEGGIGFVYRARQRTVERDVAVKVLKRHLAHDDLAVRRFENEAVAIGRLRHPNTLRLYDCRRTPSGELYLVTELLSGRPLDQVLRAEGHLSPERALRTLDEVCRSLAEAHAAGIVHRDLKPANIFLDRIGDEDVVKVLDFGIAKILQGSGGLTRAGAVPGTPHYMAPEQAASQRVDHRADLYSLGVILFQMITGHPPFDGASVLEILRQHITDPPPRLSASGAGGVPEELERLVSWLLEKAPEDRPQSVAEVRRYLPGLLAQVAPVETLRLPAPPERVVPAAALLEAPPTAKLRLDALAGLEDPSKVPGGEDPGTRGPRDDAEWGRAELTPLQRRLRWGVGLGTGAVGITLGIVIGYASTNRGIIILPQNERPAIPRTGLAQPPLAAPLAAPPDLPPPAERGEPTPTPARPGDPPPLRPGGEPAPPDVAPVITRPSTSTAAVRPDPRPAPAPKRAAAKEPRRDAKKKKPAHPPKRRGR